MTSSETHINKKVVIRDDPVQNPDGAMTMDEVFDRGKGFGGREGWLK